MDDGQVEILKTLPLLKSLSKADLRAVARRAQAFAVTPESVFIEQGGPADGVFFLLKGAVEVVENGIPARTLTAPSSFGEWECLAGESRAPATVRGAQSGLVLRISGADLLRTVGSLPPFWADLFREANLRHAAAAGRLCEVLAHFPEGLLRVERQGGQGGIITGQSARCAEYFGMPELVGKPFHEVAFAGDAEREKAWVEAFPTLFEVPAEQFAVMAQLLPGESRIPGADGSFREFQLSYHPCLKDGRLGAVDVGVRDMTEVRNQERKNAVREEEQAILARIYDSPLSYLNLLELMDKSVAGLRQLFGERGAAGGEPLRAAFRMLHSLKGLTGQYGLVRATEAAHGLESSIEDLLARGAGASATHLDTISARLEIDLIASEGARARGLLDGLGEVFKERLLGVVVPAEEFKTLREAVRRRDFEAAEALLENAEGVDARTLVADWGAETARLARTLGKQAAFRVQGEPVRIARPLARKLGACLIHLLRNALDHGLESPEARESAGKPAEGTVSVTFGRKAGALVIQVADDGRGLDRAAIAAKARSNPEFDSKRLDALIAKGEEWKILFLPGFSTAQKAGEVSGRGVGLDALLEVVNSVRGNVGVRTEPGKGTTFIIQIPV